MYLACISNFWSLQICSGIERERVQYHIFQALNEYQSVQ